MTSLCLFDFFTSLWSRKRDILTSQAQPGIHSQQSSNKKKHIKDIHMLLMIDFHREQKQHTPTPMKFG